MRANRNGFTLVEIMIVVVIIGILSRMAIPKFAATKDAARLASVRADLLDAEIAQEAYFSDKMTYGTLAQLKKASNFQLSPGNVMAVKASASGYALTATNKAITSKIKSCTIIVGKGAAATVDGLMHCP
jgi:prepilin-type N-terminal cleavage/methylation domain-containing protein